MKLTQEQRETYERDGFLVVPNLFSAAEVAEMRAELVRLEGVDTDHLVRERGTGTAKTIYRMHETDGPTSSPPFIRAARSERLLASAQALLGDPDLYIHHTKCNRKAAIDGSVWQWHQDYGTWQRDGIAEPRLTTAMIMLDRATESNGCLYFIPGSHRLGSLDPEFDDHTTAYSFWVVPKQQMMDIMEKSPEPVAITGEPGTVVFFHCNLLHGSGHNLSRFDRWQIYFVYNPVSNRPQDVAKPRPDYVRSTNWKPLRVEAARQPELA